MFEALRSLFRPDPTVSAAMEPRLAVAALLVHLAAVDGHVSAEERTALEHALTDFYGLDDRELDELIEDATRRDAESVDFFRFTSALAALPDRDKLEIIRMMWQVVFADGRNHELEDNMVWRIAELIHVPTRERNILRAQMARSGEKS